MSRQREIAIGLTHTEIMLIFAVVVLVLLLSKNYQLGQAEEKLGIIETELKKEEESISEIETRLSNEYMGKEVMALLIEGGAMPSPNPDQPLAEVQKEVVSYVQDLLTKDAENTLLQQKLETVLGSEVATLSDEEQTELLQSLEEKAEVGEEVIEALASDNEHNEVIEKFHDVLAENELLRKQVKSIAKSEGSTATAKKTGDKVGFKPCWEGAKGSKRLYYFAYKIHYDSAKKLYSIKRHQDWASKDRVVRAAIEGKLPALHDYPRNWVGMEKLRQFAFTLNKQKINVYGKECRLAAKINKEANGFITGFIRDRLFLYPIQ